MHKLVVTYPLPDDPAIHRCVLAYASDLALLDTSLVPHHRSVFERSIMAASLDHALWIHRPFRADQWLLYATHSSWAGHARGIQSRAGIRQLVLAGVQLRRSTSEPGVRVSELLGPCAKLCVGRVEVRFEVHQRSFRR